MSTNSIYTGTQGISGETGPQGPQGIQGETGPQGVDGSLSATTEIDFLTGDTSSHLEGRIDYDWGEHTLVVYNDNSNITHQLGQEFLIRVYNDSGVSLSDGTPVKFTGANGVEDRPTIAKAQADTIGNAHVIGVVTADIANNSHGYVTTKGLVNGLDLSSFSVGDCLFLDSATAGVLTATPPSDGVHIELGHVLNNSATEGRLMVSITTRQGTNFIEAWSTISATDTGAWVIRTMTGIENKNIQIVIENNATNAKTCGVRTKGSALDRKLSLAKNATITLTVRTDTNGDIEIWGDSTSLTFRDTGHLE